MCTMIGTQAKVEASCKGTGGWFRASKVAVTYDHPFHAHAENTLNIDFVDERDGLGARISAELTPESARRLVRAIESVLARAEAAGHIDAPESDETRPGESDWMYAQSREVAPTLS